MDSGVIGFYVFCRFRRGFPATFGFVIAGLIIIVGIKVLADREVKQIQAAEAKDIEEGSVDEKLPPDERTT